jgi:pyrroloquinoline quinone biosynthesis protein E
VCEKVLGVAELTMGNVHSEPLADIWISPKVKNILATPLNRISEACARCENLADCRTGCFALSLSVAGNPYATDPRCWQASYANNPYLREGGGTTDDGADEDAAR